MIKLVSFTFAVVVFLALGCAEFTFAQSKSSTARINYITQKSGVLLDLAAQYGQAEATSDPATQNFKNNTSINDLKLGFISDEDLYFGALFSAKSFSTLAGSKTSHTGGLGLGYFFRNNFNFRLFYRHDENYGDYRKGSGFQTDLEFKTILAAQIYLGVLVSHRQTTYRENDSIPFFKQNTSKETYPAITVGFLMN